MGGLRALSSVSRTSGGLIASYLEKLYKNSTSSNQRHLGSIYHEILQPCLETHSHFARADGNGVHTVQVPFHDHQAIRISDYFSGLGYFLTHLRPMSAIHSFTELVQLLSQYAEWCRTSAYVLDVNPPTVVQLLRDTSSSRFGLAASVSAGKGEGQEQVREERIQVLEGVWSKPLIYPTPVQRAHAENGIIDTRAESSAELFGTPWGHCGETVTFSALFKAIRSGHSTGTLALAVKPMTSVIPGTNTVPVQAIEKLGNLNDIVEVLRVAAAMRPMCLNCLYLADSAGVKMQDYAVTLLSHQPNVVERGT